MDPKITPVQCDNMRCVQKKQLSTVTRQKCDSAATWLRHLWRAKLFW